MPCFNLPNKIPGYSLYLPLYQFSLLNWRFSYLQLSLGPLSLPSATDGPHHSGPKVSCLSFAPSPPQTSLISLPITLPFPRSSVLRPFCPMKDAIVSLHPYTEIAMCLKGQLHPFLLDEAWTFSFLKRRNDRIIHDFSVLVVHSSVPRL